MDNDKIYYSPGDIVTVRHDLENKPKKMYVVEKVSKILKNKETGDMGTAFLGIKCRWFDTTGRLQEAVFSTKDLIHNG